VASGPLLSSFSAEFQSYTPALVLFPSPDLEADSIFEKAPCEPLPQDIILGGEQIPPR